jgi:iron complex outermembrane receptor protein
MGGRASLNLSAFYMDIRDLQLIVTAGSCSSRLVFNVPKAVTQGAEIELSAAPNQFVDLSLTGTLNKSELRSTLTSTQGSVTTVVAGIESGNRLPSVPEAQASASVTLHRQLRAGASGFFTTTFNYVGDHYTQIDDHGFGVCLNNVPLDQCPFGTVDMSKFEVAPPNGDGGATIGGPLTQDIFTFNPLLPAYSLLNLRAGITRGNWETALYLNNVTDERALLALDRERGTRARVGYLTNQPRTVGVTMRFTY